MNLAAFDWGRAASADPATLAAFVQPRAARRATSQASKRWWNARADFLTAYQDRAYAERYRALVDAVAARPKRRTRAGRRRDFARRSAQDLFKLMAYKDEYEVARLYTDGAFAAELADAFDGDLKLDASSRAAVAGARGGRGRRAEEDDVYGPWMMTAFRASRRRCGGLRGTSFDSFAPLAERRAERALVAEYEALAAKLCAGPNADNLRLGVALAALPETIRGYGPVKAEGDRKAADEERAGCWRLVARAAGAKAGGGMNGDR